MFSHLPTPICIEPILFFDRTGPTRSILYCEPMLPKGALLSKTKPLRYEWLEPLIETIRKRATARNAWLVNVKKLDATLNLDIKNPTFPSTEIHDSQHLLQSLSETLVQITTEISAVKSEFEGLAPVIQSSPKRRLSELTKESDQRIGASYGKRTRLIGVSRDAGICSPKTQVGKHPERYKIVERGYLIYNPMRINIGSIGVASADDQTGITSPDYVVFRCCEGLLPEFLYHYLRSATGQHSINQKTKGSVRFRL